MRFLLSLFHNRRIVLEVLDQEQMRVLSQTIRTYLYPTIHWALFNKQYSRK